MVCDDVLIVHSVDDDLEQLIENDEHGDSISYFMILWIQQLENRGSTAAFIRFKNFNVTASE